ncbi:MAG: tetratricopeptide repeat protein, partial [Novosphingobium sp.]
MPAAFAAAPMTRTGAAAFPPDVAATVERARKLRREGRWAESAALLETLDRSRDAVGAIAFELGLSAAAAGRSILAVTALREAVVRDPHHVQAWTSLADALRMTGAEREASHAAMMAVQVATSDPQLMRAAVALNRDDLPQAEAALRERLRLRPTDVAAIRMMGELAVRLGRLDDAARLLDRAVELAPDFDAARDLLARTLARAQRHGEAIPHARVLAERLPEQPAHRMLLAAALVQTGEHGEALTIYERLLEQIPDHAHTRMGYGHVLKTVGRQDDAVRAYRTAIAAQPTLGEVYWSLANLKTWRFAEADLAAMRAALDRVIDDEDRLHLHFALGKALEDAGDDEGSFAHYLEGNRIRRGQLDHDAEAVSRQCRRADALFTAGFFA